jgi:hypothetical protein
MDIKFFIASHWRNAEAVKSLSNVLTARGHATYSFLDNGANAVSGTSVVEEAEEFFPFIESWEGNPLIEKIFASEIQASKESEPSGRSSLTEAGIAYGMGKKIVLVGVVEHLEVVVYRICGSRYPSVEAFLADPDGVAA